MITSIIIDTLNLLTSLIIKRHELSNIVYQNTNCNEQLLHKLIVFLEEHNYPIESFYLHYPVSKYFKNHSKTMTPDLTILSSETSTPLAFFKIVNNLTDILKENFFAEAVLLNKQDNLLLHTPYYIVIFNDAHSEFEFFNLSKLLQTNYEQNFNEHFVSKIATAMPYKYEILDANEKNRVYNCKILKVDKILKIGRIAFCCIVPIILIFLLVLDALSIYVLTEFRLITVGIIIGCILIPYITQITIKDVSLFFRDDKK